MVALLAARLSARQIITRRTLTIAVTLTIALAPTPTLALANPNPSVNLALTLTRHALENAVTVLYACGGSTNCVMHLLAIAHEARLTTHYSTYYLLRTPF